MVQYEKHDGDILSLFSYHKSQYFIKSLLFRKQCKIDMVDGSAIITWGPSLIIGGEFSDVAGEMLKAELENSKSPRYIYAPEGKWERYIENTFFGNLTKKQINSYRHNNSVEINCHTDNPQC